MNTATLGFHRIIYNWKIASAVIIIFRIKYLYTRGPVVASLPDYLYPWAGGGTGPVFSEDDENKKKNYSIKKLLHAVDKSRRRFFGLAPVVDRPSLYL
jgi:hypothetical protein